MGLLGGGSVVVGWFTMFSVDPAHPVSPWAALAFLVLLLVAAVIATRLICQAGLIFVQFNYTPVEPLFSMGYTFGGAAAFAPATVVLLSIVNRVFARDIREIIMPSMMQGVKLGEDIGASRKRLYLAMALVILIAIPLSFAAFHWVTYRYSAIDIGWWTFNSPTHDMYNKVNRALTTEVKPVWYEMLYIGIGMAVMAAVILMHRRFIWWPIHPAGYCAANSWAG